MSSPNVTFYMYSVEETVWHAGVAAPLWFVTGVISSLLVHVVARHREFHTSGYLLLAALLVCEMLYMTTYALAKVLAAAHRMGVISALSDGVLGVLGFLLEGTYTINTNILTAISLQRVVAVCLPYKFTTIFSLANTGMIIGACIIIGLLPQLVMLAAGNGFYWRYSVTWLVNGAEDFGHPVGSIYLAVVMPYMYVLTACMILNYILVMAMLLKRRIRKKKVVEAAGLAATSYNSGESRGHRHGFAARALAEQGTEGNASTATNDRGESSSKSGHMRQELVLTWQFLLISIVYLAVFAIVMLPFPEDLPGMRWRVLVYNISWTLANSADVFIYLALNRALRRRVVQLVRNRAALMPMTSSSRGAASGGDRHNVGLIEQV